MRILLTIAMLTFLGVGYSQINISTSSREDAIFNEQTSEYDPYIAKRDDVTFFVLSLDSPTIKHVTESSSSLYEITYTKQIVKDKLWTLNIIDENRIEYYMIINLDDKNIRLVYRFRGSIFMTHYEIRTIWINN